MLKITIYTIKIKSIFKKFGNLTRIIIIFGRKIN